MKRAGNNPVSPRPRRGTALVFVLGVLTLLALVGMVMMARTHGEFRRVSNQSSASNYRSTMDGVVHGVQETLRRDIWGAGPNPTIPLGGNNTLSTSTALVEERNEAYDAPGDADRWLSSITPYPILDLNAASPTFGLSVPQSTGDPLLPENNVLAWPFVSYLGTDLLKPANHRPPAVPNPSNPSQGTTPFVWATNTRLPTPSPVFYSTNALKNVWMLQTPPPTVPGGQRTAPLIPGSTTNVTIATARAEWSSPAHQQALAALPEFAPGSGRVPQFPYFDTNADGVLDLYDADGDGVPDSPLSLELPVDGGDANSPRRLYAAVRIVDHAGMLNVNVASSLRRPNASSTAESSDLTFNESLAGLQRRGRRTTEQLLDELIHPTDRNYDPSDLTRDRGKGLVRARSGDRPDEYDRDILRTKLVGGRASTSLTYYPFSLLEEASLRHRGLLVPYERRFDATVPGSDYSNVDRALRNTLLWTRQTAADGTYNGSTPRWTRLVSDYLSANYEGYAGASGQGWRTLLCEDEPAAIRRHLMTTISHEVIPSPDIVQRALTPGETLGAAIDARLLQLWSLGMDWPVFIASNSPLAGDPLRPSNSFTDKFILPPGRMPPDALRVQPIDLNLGDGNYNDVKASFIRYMAAAMYLALEGVANYQGIDVGANPLNREYLAWQFALNVADYRDGDNEPTVLEWPVGMNPPHYLFGVEKQPFFTEAYAFLKAGTPSGPGPTSGGPDKWFFAVELFVPPYWQIPSGDLYLMVPQPGVQPPRRYALSDFLHRTAGTPPNVMNGGASGRYYVFCGINANAPSFIQTNPLYAEFYQFVPKPGLTDFQLPTDGTAQVQLVHESPTVPMHHLDVIGGDYCDRMGETESDTANLYLGGGPHQPVTTFATNPGGLTPGEQYEYVLQRSTNGWRFTTAWHHFAEGRAPGPAPTSSRPVPKSLGLPNEPTANPLDPDAPAPQNKTRWLDRILPESQWPARATVSGGALPGGFAALSPYQSFDSPADLSKLLIVGSLTQLSVAPPQINSVLLFNADIGAGGTANLPPTAFLAALCRARASTAVTAPRYREYASVGRIDFTISTVSKRLFAALTTVSPLFDGVDNDGNGATDMADPLEAMTVMNKVAGRINVNTAPASVLRCVPYMSLLPTSPEYLFHVVMGGGVNPIPAGYNPHNEYFNTTTPRPFWDLASAIVATREQREVALRLLDTDTGYTPPGYASTRLRTVATAYPFKQVCPGPGPTSGSGGTYKGPITNLADLARLNDREHCPARADDVLFNIDRFARDPRLRPLSHRHGATADPALGIESVLSPDYRFVRTSPTDGLVEYSAIPRIVPAQQEVELGGLRSRDVLLARWANHLTVRSDVFTAYIALIDENGRTLERSEVTLDRSLTFRESAPPAGQPRKLILPTVVRRLDTSYTDDTK